VSRARALYFLVSAVISAGIGYAVTNVVDGTSLTSSVRILTQGATSRSVAGALWGGKIVSAGNDLEISTATSSGTCVEASVNPETLQVGPMTSCYSPSSRGIADIIAPPFGQHISVEELPAGNINRVGSCEPRSGELRALRFNGTGQPTPLGRPFMLFDLGCSGGTYPQVAYGAGLLWIYDCAGGPHQNQGELAEVSATTGVLEQLVSMPSVCREIIAADTEGVFIGPGDGFALGSAIYHVAPNSRKTEVVHRLNGPLAWMYGSGSDLFVEQLYNYAQPCRDNGCQLWRFSGPASYPTELRDNLDEQTPVVGNSTVDLFFVEATGRAWINPAEGPFELREISASTGEVTAIVRLAPSRAWWDDDEPSSASPSIDLFRNSLFVLLPGRIYRFPLPD